MTWIFLEMRETEISQEKFEGKYTFKPCIIVLAGPPLSGKTTLGNRLHNETNGMFLDVDVRRSQIFRDKQNWLLPEDEHFQKQEMFAMQTSYQANHERARNWIKAGTPVVLAATYSRELYHRMIRDLSKETGVFLAVFKVEPPKSDEELLKRLEGRNSGNNPSNVKTLEHFYEVLNRYRSPQKVPIRRLDTGKGVEENIREIIQRVEEVQLEEGLPFSILIEGKFESNQLVVHPTDHSILHSQEINGFLESYWQKHAGISRDESLVSYIGVWDSYGQLNIETGYTNYKDRIGTQSDEYAQLFPHENKTLTIGTSCILKTSDDKIVLAQRLTPHPTKSGGLHVIGGFAHPEDVKDGNLNFEISLRREIKEETGVEIVENVMCIGVSEDLQGNISLLFTVDAPITEKEIRQQQGDKEVSLIFISDTRDDLEDMVLRSSYSASTPSIALAYLYGKEKFGKDWSRRLLQRLNKRLNLYKGLQPAQKETMRQKKEGRLSRLE